MAEWRLASGDTATAFDKTLGAILSTGILAVIGWSLLPSAGPLFLVLFVLAVAGAVSTRVRR